MSFMSGNVRGVLRLIAADFVVATGLENGSKSTVTVLWSGPEKQLAYFQRRIFGSNTVTLHRVGRRPMVMLDSLLSKLNCSFSVIISRRGFVSVIERPGDICLPLWVDCTIDLNENNFFAKSESVRRALLKIRKNRLTWRVSIDRDDFEFFFENIYRPTLISSHGSAALPASQHKRLQQIDSGTLELIQILRDDQCVAGVTIDYRGHIPTLRDNGVLGGSPEFKKLDAVAATYLFGIEYLASRGCSKVGVGLSRSFLDDGVLNYKRKFRPVVSSGSTDCALIRIHQLDNATRSMLCSSPCVSWQGSELRRTYFRDMSRERPRQHEREKQNDWWFGLDAESVFDVSGESIQPLNR